MRKTIAKAESYSRTLRGITEEDKENMVLY